MAVRRACTAAVAAASALMLIAPASGAATRAPSDEEKLKVLTAKMKKLDKEYGSELEQLKSVQRDAAKALKLRDDLNSDLEKSHTAVARMASSQYMSQGADPELFVLNDDDTSNALGAASMVRFISSNEARRKNQIQVTADLQVKAAKDAKGKIVVLQKTVKDLESRRASIKALIRRYKPESPSIGMRNLTPRMNTLYTEIESKFGPFPTIGCFRSGDPQDHGSGRACDFMEALGGSMPTAAHVTHGNNVSQFAINNASKYGVKYIIWRQRIYDMRSPGWKAMSDRGGVTANHYDHVHISVF
jgi:gas vesicle protein